MRFKELPSWLKGGIILGFVSTFVYLVLIVFFSSIGNIIPEWLVTPLGALIFLLGMVFFLIPLSFFILNLSLKYKLLISSTEVSAIPTFLGAIIMILIWFIIGAFIGWIIKKRKVK